MLGWGYRFCEKSMLIKSEMTSKEADKFMTKFDNIYKSGLTEEAREFNAVLNKSCNRISSEMLELVTIYDKFFEGNMKVFDLI